MEHHTKARVYSGISGVLMFAGIMGFGGAAFINDEEAKRAEQAAAQAVTTQEANMHQDDAEQAESSRNLYLVLAAGSVATSMLLANKAQKEVRLNWRQQHPNVQPETTDNSAIL